MHRLASCRSISTTGSSSARTAARLKKELIEAERDFIYQLLRDGKITDEARRRIEYELDLEEASLANRRETYGGLAVATPRRAARRRSGARCNRSPSA